MAKIISFAKACELSKKFRHEGKKVVFTSGCFDILHIGHMVFFKKIRKLFGAKTILFLGVESDKYIKLRKGENRPIFSQKIRVEVMSMLTVIDYVIKLTFTTDYKKRYQKINPNYITFGNNEFINTIRKDTKELQIGFKHLPHKIKKSSTSKIVNILLDNFSS